MYTSVDTSRIKYYPIEDEVLYYKILNSRWVELNCIYLDLFDCVQIFNVSAVKANNLFSLTC